MTNLATSSILAKNEPAAVVWDSGATGYDLISRQISDAIEHCVDRLAPRPEESILDVATGTGWTARRVAMRHSRVTAVDLSNEAIRIANKLAPGLGIDFLYGDAEALPFGHGQFDAVVSTFGVMFCSDQEAAAAELARVCKSGGRLSLAVWADHGGVKDLFNIISRFKPTPTVSQASPFSWSDPNRIDQLLGRHFEWSIERAISYHREQKPQDAWEVFAEGYGPIRSLLPTLSPERAEQFQTDFVDYHRSHMTDVGVLVERPYLIIHGVRK